MQGEAVVGELVVARDLCRGEVADRQLQLEVELALPSALIGSVKPPIRRLDPASRHEFEKVAGNFRPPGR